MSGDMFSNSNKSIDFYDVFHKKINLPLTRETYCSYEGECKKGLCVNSSNLCEHCVYKKKLDIPFLLEKYLYA